ncbi:hypothetical protein FACS1894154_12460 [Betaproteobacteria bacterium]|nr:hypothetical protein FACS1894154_12460 [Betaproteobacteria bacterium]
MCVCPTSRASWRGFWGVIADAGINVVYSYSLISTLIAIHVKDIAATEAVLRHQPIELVSQNDMVW